MVKELKADREKRERACECVCEGGGGSENGINGGNKYYVLGFQ